MKIGFYSPYLDTLGGGERYLFTLASHWSETHRVNLFWDDRQILEAAQQRFALDLSKINVVPNFFRLTNFFSRVYQTRLYDLIFVLSDGSIPTSLAKYNLLHFQVPFRKIAYNRLKMQRYQTVVCNSEFTKNHLDSRLRDKAVVIYPPVRAIPDDSSIKKTKMILSVGRFTSFHQAKKQEIMISAFKRIADDLPGWKLVLAGGLHEQDRDYFQKLKQRIKGSRIELLTNFDYAKLVKLYQQASIYWHAAGFGESEPADQEHFGISTVEAMSAGVVPLVFAGGGQKEIVENAKTGFLWKTAKELTDRTLALAENLDKYQQVRQQARKKSHDFSEIVFERKFDQLISKPRTYDLGRGKFK